MGVFGVLLYFLTMNPEVQSKLQDDIAGLKYLDRVVCEGQRMGCFAFTARLCTKTWAVPGSDFVIPADTRIVITIVGLHYDPNYFPNPERFDPDRFADKGSYDSITFQTFGTGPRQCLGKNLYIVESKVLLIHLLREFSLKPTPQTPRELQWDTEVFIGAK